MTLTIDQILARMIRNSKFRYDVCTDPVATLGDAYTDLSEEEKAAIDLLCEDTTTIGQLEEGLGSIGRTLGVTDR